MTILDRILGHERRALKAARHSSNPSTAGSAGVAKAETGNSGRLTDAARAVRRVTTGAIRAALEAGGVEFTNGDQPGVRLRKG